MTHTEICVAIMNVKGVNTMHYNNFDQNSEGINIEIEICYDLDMARSYKNDILKFDKKSGVYFLYSDKIYNSDFNNWSRFLEIKELPKDFIKDVREAEGMVEGQEWEMSDYIQGYLEMITDNLFDAAERIDSRVKHKKLYRKYLINGYSQGEISKVIMLNDDYKEYVGKEYTTEEEFKIRNILQDTIYNTPVYCKVTHNKEEYHMDDLEGYQIYDKNEYARVIIDTIMESYTFNTDMKDKVSNYVYNILPNELEYE